MKKLKNEKQILKKYINTVNNANVNKYQFMNLLIS